MNIYGARIETAVRPPAPNFCTVSKSAEKRWSRGASGRLMAVAVTDDSN